MYKQIARMGYYGEMYGGGAAGHTLTLHWRRATLRQWASVSGWEWLYCRYV